MREIFKSRSFKAFILMLFLFVVYSLLLTLFIAQITPLDLKGILSVKHLLGFLPLSMVVAITDFGFTSSFLPYYAFICGLCLAQRRFITIAVLIFNSLFFVSAVDFVKTIFMRDRPDVLLQRVAETGFSYPSGHTSTAFYFGVLTLYLISVLCKDFLIKRILYTLVGAWMVVLPLTRIWLGVHYPSDIVGGMIFGTMWACFTITFIQIDYKTSK